MTNHTAYHTDIDSTVALAEGAIIKDFRGDEWSFVGVTRGPSEGRSAKVEVRYLDGDYASREFYSTVFPGLEVI